MSNSTTSRLAKIAAPAIATALAPIRQAIFERIEAHLIARTAVLYAQLEKDGGDMNVTYSSYVSGENRFQAVNRQESRAFALEWTDTDTTERPWTVNAGKSYWRKCFTPAKLAKEITAKANRDADAMLASYAWKMTAKTGEMEKGREIAGAEYSGGTNPWGHSILKITFADNGEPLKLATQIIVNTSVHGKLFNQFPTRRVA